MPEDASELAGKGSPSSGRPGRRRIVALAIVGLVLLLVALFVLLRDSTPLLDAAVLEQERERWLQSPLRDYDLRLHVEVEGQDPQFNGVQVRDGSVVSQTLNGEPVESRSAAYTIDGLFQTLDTEVALAGKPLRDGTTGHTTLRALFDEKLAVPVVFKRFTSRATARSVLIRIDSLTSPGGGTLYSAEASPR